MKVLVTGGAGYIGATVVSACLDAGITPIVLDDLSTGREAHLEGRDAYIGDIADGGLIDRIAEEHSDLFAVIHCAARIVVPESVADPLAYYEANVAKSIRLFQHLRRNGIGRVVFSSSASIYASDNGGGVAEDNLLAPASPYAHSKAMVEQILQDAAGAGSLRALSLRYFNPIGNDPLLRTGPTSDSPTHVLGLLLTAWEGSEPFTVTGTDWPTSDGSGVRDFVHVWDLAKAHVRAVERFDAIVTSDEPHVVLNLGTGVGTTIHTLVGTFERVAGGSLDVRFGSRRPGDSAGAFALVSRARTALEWTTELTVADGIRDALAWRALRRRG